MAFEDKAKMLSEKLRGKLKHDMTDQQLEDIVRGYQEDKEISLDRMSEVSRGITKEQFEQIHIEYLNIMREHFEHVKRKTGGGVTSLQTFADNLGSIGNMITKTAPTIGMQEAFGTYSMWLHHDKIYSIHDNLCRRFVATNIKSVPTELIRLPFPAFKILVPANVLKYTTFEKKEVWIRELIVIKYQEKGEGYSRLMVLHRAFDDIGFFNVDLNEAEVHDCVEGTVSKFKEISDELNRIQKCKDQFGPVQQDEMRDIFEFSLKCILYITGADSDIRWVDETPELENQLKRAKTKGNMKKIQRKLDKAKKMYLVGHKIILSREEKMMYDNIKKGLWKVSFRFIVQGHWRNQAYGPSRKSRKLIFIEPHWRGPTYAEVINSEHIVK